MKNFDFWGQRGADSLLAKNKKKLPLSLVFRHRYDIPFFSLNKKPLDFVDNVVVEGKINDYEGNVSGVYILGFRINLQVNIASWQPYKMTNPQKKTSEKSEFEFPILEFVFLFFFRCFFLSGFFLMGVCSF